MLSILTKLLRKSYNPQIAYLAQHVQISSSINKISQKQFSDHAKDKKAEEDIQYPNFVERSGESEEELRSRLLYQSRKRGTLEVGLLLSTFASKHLSSMTEAQLHDYDKIINHVHNEWDIYYWLLGSKEIPKDYKCSTMDLMVEFAKNKEKEIRVTQPDLPER